MARGGPLPYNFERTRCPMKLFLPLLALSTVCLPGQIATPNGSPPSFNFDSYLEVLRPAGTPQFRSLRGAGDYSFEALIRWEALPPFASLELKELRLAVEVPGGDAEAAPAWIKAMLEAGRRFHVTACDS